MDRAARAWLGPPRPAGGEGAFAPPHTAAAAAAASLLGQAAAAVVGPKGSTSTSSRSATTMQGGGSSRRLLPLVAPDHLVLPHLTNVTPAAVPATFQPNGPILSQPPPPQQQQQQQQQQQHRQQPPHSATARVTVEPLHQQQPSLHQYHQHHQYHPSMMIMAQQQQQQQMMNMMMMQQNQMLRMRQAQLDQQQQLQQQQQQQQLQSTNTTLTTTTTVRDDQTTAAATTTTTVPQAQAQAQAQTPPEEGHEGWVQGATIQELAAAWAQAEAEYEELEAAVNLAAAVNGNVDEQEQAVLLAAEHRPTSMMMTTTTTLPAYEFIHTMNNVEVAPLPPQDWMEQGKRHFQAGDLKKAIRAFEMELQQNNPDNATAWRLLGQCHAENDQDREAIVCLEHAVDRDPYSPEACLALGVSYVNELNHAQALQSLKAWITHNPKFAGLDLAPSVHDLYASPLTRSGSTVTESAFDEVQRLLLRALEVDPSSPDVLEALGVVYNVSRDYEAAIDAFERAIAVHPHDYQLYNRLGATLANCQQSEKALPVYHKALQLKPKYARAWLNLAISHSNLNNYQEAARCYLQTLSLNPAATHCWSYLRIALSCNEQWDLIPYTTSMDLSAFADHFDFVRYDT